jgi:hypothetical protein
MKYIKEFPRGEFGYHDVISTGRELLDRNTKETNIIANALADAEEDACYESGTYLCDENTKSKYNLRDLMGADKELYTRMYCLFAKGLYAKYKLNQLERALETLKGFWGK